MGTGVPGDVAGVVQWRPRLRGSRVRERPRWLAALAVLLLGTAPLSALAQDESDEESSEDTDTSSDDGDSTGDSDETEAESAVPPAESPPPAEEAPPGGDQAVPVSDVDEAGDGYTASSRQLKRRRARAARASSAAAHHERKHRRFAVGFRGTGLAAFHKGDAPVALGGPGGFVEFSAVHGELGLELAARALIHERSLHIPIHFLLKKPWEVKRTRFYLGVGPALVVGVDLGEAGDGEHEEAGGEPSPPTLHFGFAGVGGMTYWFRDRVGLNTELNYNIVIHGGATHELGASVGLVFVL